MCLAVPLKIVSLEGDFAWVKSAGFKKRINIQILTDKVEIDDYVLVHAGFAIEKIDPVEAKKTLSLLDRIT